MHDMKKGKLKKINCKKAIFLGLILTFALFQTLSFADTITWTYPNLPLSYAGCDTTQYLGIYITTNYTENITAITKETSCTGTKAYVVADVDKIQLGQAAFSGNMATFAPPVYLSDNTSYYILIGKDGSTYCRGYGTPSFPFWTPRFNVIQGGDNISGNFHLQNYHFNIASITTVDIIPPPPIQNYTLDVNICFHIRPVCINTLDNRIFLRGIL
jgi:hypothetical protein